MAAAVAEVGSCGGWWQQQMSAAEGGGVEGGGRQQRLRRRVATAAAADGGRGQLLWQLMAVSEEGGVSDVITYKNSIRREKKCYS